MKELLLMFGLLTCELLMHAGESEQIKPIIQREILAEAAKKQFRECIWNRLFVNDLNNSTIKECEAKVAEFLKTFEPKD